MPSRRLLMLLVIASAIAVIAAARPLSLRITPAAPPPQPSAAELVTQMTNPALSFEGRCAAEDALAKLTSAEVLDLLRPYILQNPRDIPMCHDCGTGLTRDDDKGCPFETQVYAAAHRAWYLQLQGLIAAGNGVIIIDMIENGATSLEQASAIYTVGRHWIPEAEAPLVALLRDVDADTEFRRQAAAVLNEHSESNFIDLELSLAANEDHFRQNQWLTMLLNPNLRDKRGIDPRVVRMSFEWIMDELQESPTSQFGSAFFGWYLGQYLGQRFQPDRQLPQYNNGNAPEFHRDTVTNALAWWDANKECIEAEITTMESAQPAPGE